ncbi:alpha/beta hydrolase [Sphingomonas sp. LHG3406-1]|uniref:alpha/beta hydrolase n=1 Tax=Sphingomonas sp. LHG3406-1 TaxID=2804617 RepID=UPI00261EB8F1|nr:alpha/beta hydrolase [Sphingomonas sp. LHG3406-1]
MARSSRRRRWPNLPKAAAEMVDRFGWSPVALLNTIDRLTPGRGDRARKLGEGLRFGPHARHHLDVWAPSHPDSAKLPIVVFFYGGGWHSGERTDYGFAGAAFAAQGFLTIVPDYRLVPEVRYPDFLEDAALALRWVWTNAIHYGGDPARISVAGHSAGAYIAAMLALDPRWLAAAQLPSDTVKAGVLLSGPFDFAPFREWRGRATFGSHHDPAETQPINHVRADAPPLLLLHGRSDRLVYAKNSRSLDAALTAVGAPHEIKIYPGCDHAGTVVALSRPFRHRHPVLADAAAFLRSVLGLPTSSSKE